MISGSSAMSDFLPDTVIHTDRVALRPIVRDDVSTLARLLFDPAVLVWMPALRMIVSIRDAEALFEAAISLAGPERFDFVALRRRDGAPIGEVTVPSSGGELEFWLASEFWGQGYATEIVSCVLHLLYASKAIEPIFACVHRDNIGSQRVLQKAGMEVAEAYWHRFEAAENPVPLLTYRVDVMFSPSTPYRIAKCTSSVSPEFVDARPTGVDFSKFCFHHPFSQQRNHEVDECAQFQRQSALPVIDEMKRARLGLEFLQDDT